MFIHGGAWRTRAVKDYAFMAEMFVRAGAHWIGLDFDGVESTNGDLLPMADQVRRAVAWVYKNAASFGGDPNRIYVSGAVVRRASRRLRRDHRLEGLRRAERHREGRAARARACTTSSRCGCRSARSMSPSPTRSRRSCRRSAASTGSNCPVIVAYGTFETPEFQRQNREFAAAVKAAGKPVTLLVGEGYNHFEMAEDDRQSAEPRSAARCWSR